MNIALARARIRRAIMKANPKKMFTDGFFGEKCSNVNCRLRSFHHCGPGKESKKCRHKLFNACKACQKREKSSKSKGKSELKGCSVVACRMKALMKCGRENKNHKCRVKKFKRCRMFCANKKNRKHIPKKCTKTYCRVKSFVVCGSNVLLPHQNCRQHIYSYCRDTCTRRKQRRRRRRRQRAERRKKMREQRRKEEKLLGKGKKITTGKCKLVALARRCTRSCLASRVSVCKDSCVKSRNLNPNLGSDKSCAKECNSESRPMDTCISHCILARQLENGCVDAGSMTTTKAPVTPAPAPCSLKACLDYAQKKCGTQFEVAAAMDCRTEHFRRCRVKCNGGEQKKSKLSADKGRCSHLKCKSLARKKCGLSLSSIAYDCRSRVYLRCRKACGEDKSRKTSTEKGSRSKKRRSRKRSKRTSKKRRSRKRRSKKRNTSNKKSISSGNKRDKCVRRSDTVRCVLFCDKNKHDNGSDFCIRKCVHRRMKQRGCRMDLETFTIDPCIPRNRDRNTCVKDCSDSGSEYGSCCRSCVRSFLTKRGCAISHRIEVHVDLNKWRVTKEPTVCSPSEGDMKRCVSGCQKNGDSGVSLDDCSSACVRTLMVQRGCVTTTKAKSTKKPSKKGKNGKSSIVVDSKKMKEEDSYFFNEFFMDGPETTTKATTTQDPCERLKFVNQCMPACKANPVKTCLKSCLSNPRRKKSSCKARCLNCKAKHCRLECVTNALVKNGCLVKATTRKPTTKITTSTPTTKSPHLCVPRSEDIINCGFECREKSIDCTSSCLKRRMVRRGCKMTDPPKMQKKSSSRVDVAFCKASQKLILLRKQQYENGTACSSVMNYRLKNKTVKQVLREIGAQGGGWQRLEAGARISRDGDWSETRTDVGRGTSSYVVVTLENSDGSMIRLTPEGRPSDKSLLRKPHGEIFCKIDALGGTEFTNIAFKIDAKGKAQPKWEADIAAPKKTTKWTKVGLLWSKKQRNTASAIPSNVLRTRFVKWLKNKTTWSSTSSVVVLKVKSSKRKKTSAKFKASCKKRITLKLAEIQTGEMKAEACDDEKCRAQMLASVQSARSQLTGLMLRCGPAKRNSATLIARRACDRKVSAWNAHLEKANIVISKMYKDATKCKTQVCRAGFVSRLRKLHKKMRQVKRPACATIYIDGILPPGMSKKLKEELKALEKRHKIPGMPPTPASIFNITNTGLKSHSKKASNNTSSSAEIVRELKERRMRMREAKLDTSYDSDSELTSVEEVKHNKKIGRLMVKSEIYDQAEHMKVADSALEKRNYKFVHAPVVYVPPPKPPLTEEEVELKHEIQAQEKHIHFWKAKLASETLIEQEEHKLEN